MEAEVPVFRPSLEQFRDFNAFIHSIEDQARPIGLCKVIPPKEWRDELDQCQLQYEKNGANMKLAAPIRQYVEVDYLEGVYHITNQVEQQNMSVVKYQRNAKLLDCKDNTEEKFWNALGRENPPIYGADNLGTFFAHHPIPWNLNNLGTVLDKVGSKLAGVTTPYLYFGQWRTRFALHTEDMDLWAINYIHYGASKQWYVIPPAFSDRVENVCREYFPEHFRKCPEYLRHKSILIHPDIFMLSHSIPVYKMRQEAQEFIITWPRAYHFGFNYGTNCAESVNFGTNSWVKYGQAARICRCSRNNVFINMNEFLNALNDYNQRQSEIDDNTNEMEAIQSPKLRKFNTFVDRNASLNDVQVKRRRYLETSLVENLAGTT